MNIIVKAVAGSHLFGTNTEKSDRDFKGVYIPSQEDILLGKVRPSVSIKTNNTGNKNTAEDVDVEYYSLQKFMKMLYEGQTVAIELLWTPNNLILETSTFWEELQRCRGLLMHKQVTAFTAYCKTQADKYGVKGSRMGAVKKVIEFLNDCPQDAQVFRVMESMKEKLSAVEHVKFYTVDTEKGSASFIEVCNRNFQDTTRVGYILHSLVKIYDNYGHRARQAETNEGVDFKALSHAYRVCCQAEEILLDGKLTLPLKPDDRNMVRMIKEKELPFTYVRDLLEAKLELVAQAQTESKLPDHFDYDSWCKEYVMGVYKLVINGFYP